MSSTSGNSSVTGGAAGGPPGNPPAGGAAAATAEEAAAAAAAQRREELKRQSGKKGPGSMSYELFCTASESAATHEASVLPTGHTLVVASKPHTQGQIGETLHVPTPSTEPSIPVQPFSCLRCLTHPDVAAEPSLTQGYGRLQVLLAYLMPEVTETLEEQDPAVLLRKGSAAAAAAAEPRTAGSLPGAGGGGNSTTTTTKGAGAAGAHKSPTDAASTPATAAAATKNEMNGLQGPSAPRSAVPHEFTVTALNPTRGYVRLSLNGVPVYRSSVLKISPEALNDAAAVLQGRKEEAKLPQTIFNERVEIQIHEPYSVLRVELFNRDVTLGVLADDDLLGVFEVPIHLLKPRKIYDIEAEFPPEALREENEEWISGQGLDSPFVLGEKRLLPPAATAQLLQTKHIFDPEVAAAAAVDEVPEIESDNTSTTTSGTSTTSTSTKTGVKGGPAGSRGGSGTTTAASTTDYSTTANIDQTAAAAERVAAEKAAAEALGRVDEKKDQQQKRGAPSSRDDEEQKDPSSASYARGAHELQQEARKASAATHAKLVTSSSHRDIDLLSCPLNLAAAAAASAPQMGGLRSSSFSLESRSTTVEESDLTTAAVATGTAALQQQQSQETLLPGLSSIAKTITPDNNKQQQQTKPSSTITSSSNTARPPLLPLGFCACGPRLRCLFKMEVVGATSLGHVGLARDISRGPAFSAAAELCALALPTSLDDLAATARLPQLNYRKLLHDVKRLKFLVWDLVLLPVTETIGILPTWRRPVLSATCLASLLLVTLEPLFIYPAIFFFLGWVMLLLSRAKLSTSPPAAVAAASVLAASKKKPPDEVLVPGSTAAAERERKGQPPEGAAHAAASATSPTLPTPPPTLEAFEAQQQSDDTRLEDSLVKGLLSAAVPKSLNRRLRYVHSLVITLISVVLRMHHKLCMRREVIVGTLWALSVISLYMPRLVGALIRYTIGGAGILVMMRQMPIVGTALRFAIACASYTRLLYERATKQHLVAAPIVF